MRPIFPEITGRDAPLPLLLKPADGTAPALRLLPYCIDGEVEADMGNQRGSKDQQADAPDKARDEEKREIDADLDEALKESFPASDPAAVGRPSAKPDRPEHRQTPVIDLDEVRRLARKVK